METMTLEQVRDALYLIDKLFPEITRDIAHLPMLADAIDAHLRERESANKLVPDVLPSELRIESWPVQQDGMHVGMPRGVKINHVTTGHVCICNSERSQHKNRDIALAGIKAMLAADLKPEKE